MKLDAGEIKDLVTETERKQANWVAWADEWEQMWLLANYDDLPEDYRDLDGLDAITLPDPFNIIQLLQRFVASETRVEIPYLSPQDEDDERSELMEEWTIAFDEESNRQLGKHHTSGKTWQSGVLGKGASRVMWIGDVAPEGLQNRIPILRENLDPRNVGVARGPFGTEWAFHKYKATRSYVERHYPKFKLADKNSIEVRHGYWNEKYTVIDFWAWHQGKVWHTVTINDEYALKPRWTDYPDVPIITWNGDGAPVDNSFGQSISILHPIRDAYKLKNDFVSTMATGLRYHYHPMVLAKNMGDQRIQVGPGAIVYLKDNQSLDAFRAEPNVPMAQALLQILQTSIDQATFSAVSYGDGESGASGYAINSLAQAARSRANVIRANIEAAEEAEYQLIYGIIDKIAGDEGVEIYGRSSRGDRGKPLRLTSKDIKGNYANKVMLVPESPMDDNARILAWMQMVEKGIVSKDMMRNRIINVSMPRDEETRVAVETALTSPEMSLKVQLRALQKTYKQEDWEMMISGTPLEPVYQAEEEWKANKEAEKQAEKDARKAAKEQKELQEALTNMPPMPMPLGGGQPGSIGPEGAGALPPMGGPPGMQPLGGLPPIGQGPLPGQGMPSSPSPQGMMPQGMSPEMMPPEMMGMSPEAMGMDGAPPGMYQELTGQPPLSDEEMLRRQGGLPPGPQF